MEDGSLQSRGEYLRSVAAKLRGIANGLRFDFRRADQLRSLADGFERFAERLEQDAGPDKAQGRAAPLRSRGRCPTSAMVLRRCSCSKHGRSRCALLATCCSDPSREDLQVGPMIDEEPVITGDELRRICAVIRRERPETL